MKAPRRAFMLIQIMFVLVLLAAFTVAGTRVLRMSVLTTQKASREQEWALRVERALGALRADVWQAKSIDSNEPGRLRISGGTDGPVEWRTGDDGELVRSTDNGVQKWPELHVRFQGQGLAILLTHNQHTLAVLERGVTP
jgi:hypothetical protein